MKKSIYIISLLLAIFIVACTIGISHKIIINDYSDKDDSTISKKKNYNIIITNYPADTTDIKKSRFKK